MRDVLVLDLDVVVDARFVDEHSLHLEGGGGREFREKGHVVGGSLLAYEPVVVVLRFEKEVECPPNG